MAGWADAFIRGAMSGSNLVAALGDFVEEFPPDTDAPLRDRLIKLVGDVSDALARDDARDRVEAVVEEFLGCPPSEVMAHRPPPDWRSEV